VERFIVLEFDVAFLSKGAPREAGADDVAREVLETFIVEDGSVDSDEVEIVKKHGVWHLRIPVSAEKRGENDEAKLRRL